MLTPQVRLALAMSLLIGFAAGTLLLGGRWCLLSALAASGAGLGTCLLVVMRRDFYAEGVDHDGGRWELRWRPVDSPGG